MRSLALLLAIALPGTFDSVKLAHTYTKGDKTTYTVKITSKADDVSIDADIDAKVLSDTKDGITSIEISSPKVTLKVSGDVKSDNAATATAKVDARGVPDKLEINDEQMPLSVLQLAGILPNQDVEVGKQFKLEFKNDTVGAYASTSTLKEIKEIEGKKQWIIESEVSFAPQQDHEGILKMTNTFDDSGRLLKCTGTISVQDKSLDLSIVKK